jgi:hypothetical protein
MSRATTTPSFVSNGPLPLPDGADGQLAVVATGRKTNNVGTVPAVLRNNTGKTLRHQLMRTTAYAPDGTLLGITGASPVSPEWIEPGDLAFGGSYWMTSLPDDTRYVYETMDGDPSLYQDYALELEGTQFITGRTQRENRFTGTIRNPNAFAVMLISVEAFCFDTSGNLIGWSIEDSSTTDSLNSGERGFFQVTIGTECPIYAVFAEAPRKLP